MYRIISGICILLVFAIGVLWLMIDQRSEDIRQLNRFAAAGNSQTPQMINEFTRLDSVSTDNSAVVFHYTVLLPKAEIDIAAIERQEYNWFVGIACENEQVQKMVLNPGYEIVRSYMDSSDNKLLTIRLGGSLCQERT